MATLSYESRAGAGGARERVETGGRGTTIGLKDRKRIRTCDDPRRGGERGSSPRSDSGGEEPDRVSTVANDP